MTRDRTTTERSPTLAGETRRKAWETRRDKYGPRGHSGAYSRASAHTGSLSLVIRMLREGVLSEGQVQAETGLDRVEIRRLADSGEAGLAGYEADAIGVVDQAHPAPVEPVELREKVALDDAAQPYEDVILALISRLRAAEGALRPFATEQWGDLLPDDTPIFPARSFNDAVTGLTAGDFRAARAALSLTNGEGAG